MQRNRAAHQSESADKANKPKTVVTVQVGNEDVTELVKRQSGTAQLDLRTFAAINHEELSPALHHLHRREMASSGQGTATAQNMYSKWFHPFLFLSPRSTVLPSRRGSSRQADGQPGCCAAQYS